MTPIAVPFALRLRLATIALSATMTFGLATAVELGTITESTETFKSRRKDVIVDVFAPSAPGKHPAAIVLHGRGGVSDSRRSGTHQAARELAQAGYVAFVPHYFGRNLPDPKNGPKNARSHAIWTRTVLDTISFATRRDDVNPRQIGLVGFSHGSWLALSVAARDRRVSAVVEYYGGYPGWDEIDPARLPPVLILHGYADRVVPVNESDKLEAVLKEAGVPYEMHIYPGADHGFRGADREDALKRSLEFFATHVKQEGPSTAPRAPATGSPSPDDETGTSTNPGREES
jgi:carboxymethylenebutenolidase